MGVKVEPRRIAGPLALAYRAWCATLRYQLHGYEHFLAARDAGKRLVICLWHDELFPLTHLARRKNVPLGTVVSQSRDGEVLALTLERLGVVCARGSSSRGGVKALKTARRLVEQQGRVLVVTVDGPRGPRHQAKEGAAYLAAASGALLAPMRVRMARAYRFERAWDRFQVPYPFSRIDVAFGRPYAPRVDAVQMRRESGAAAETARLEAALHNLKKDFK